MTTSQTSPDELTASIEIDAAPAQVGEEGPDLGGGGEVKQGARMINLNQQGWKRWPTNAKVVRFTPHSDLAFRVTENRTIWSFQLEPLEDGARTKVTHRRETPDGISGLSKGMTKVALGGMDAFAGELTTGMGRTLERVKAAAEA